MEVDEFHVANASPVPKSSRNGRKISQKGQGDLRKRNLGLSGSWGLVSGGGGTLLSFPPVKGVKREPSFFLKSILLQSANSMSVDLDLGLWIWISLRVHSLCLGVICPVLLCFLVASLILQSIMQHR